VCWASAYTLKLKRTAAFEGASHNFVASIKANVAEHPLRLMPDPASAQI